MKFLNFSHHDHYSHRMAHTANRSQTFRADPTQRSVFRHKAIPAIATERSLQSSDEICARVRCRRNEKGHETSTDSYEKYACNPGDVSWRRLCERPGRASTRGGACACPAAGGRPGSNPDRCLVA